MMIKKQWLFLTLALTILVAAACATPSTPESQATSAPPIPQISPTPEEMCPAATEGLRLFVATEDGYCLLYPADYSMDIPRYIVINPIDSPGDIPGDAWVNIAVEDAAGRTAAQVADGQIAEAGEGFNITRSEILVDGMQAVVVDGLPGPDPSRRVFIASNDRLYTLTFMPWAPSNDSSQPTPLENLYTTIMDTIHFLP